MKTKAKTGLPEKDGGIVADKATAVATILDTAERVFARYGYDGASMRTIAEESGISQALIHYHFKKKEKLYEAVFARRSSIINPYRERLLDEALDRDGGPRLEDVLDALFSPAAAPLGDEHDSDSRFSQIVAAIVLGEDARSRDLMTRYYDPIALRFVHAFQRSVPGLSRENAVWAYMFAHGARMQAYARSGRADRLMGVPDGAIGREDALQAIKRFVAAGIRALAETPEP